jgi:rubrerythrin
LTVSFDADEIFEIAEQIERNGATFYRRAAEKLAGSDERQILLELATLEEAHEKTFAAMRKDLSDSEALTKSFDPHGEAASYLRAMAEGRVFDFRAGLTDFFTGNETAEDILKKAIGLEKDSIAFYLGMKEMVSQRLGRNKIEHIIREEMAHIVSLNRALAAHNGSASSQRG